MMKFVTTNSSRDKVRAISAPAMNARVAQAETPRTKSLRPRGTEVGRGALEVAIQRLQPCETPPG